MLRRLLALSLCCAAALSWPAPAWAQDPAPPAAEDEPDDTAPEADGEAPARGETPSAPVVKPPELMAFVEAEYPEQAREDKLAAQVVLLLTIGSDGFVEEAQLAGEPVGHGFDEAALRAGRRLLFTPATQDGEPVRSRIQFKYTFEWRPAPQAEGGEQDAPPEPPPTGQLDVVVREAQSDAPLSDTEVLVTSLDDPELTVRAVTDAQGRIHLEGLPPGQYEVAADVEDFEAEIHQERVLAGQLTEAVYRLSPERRYEGFGATARVKSPPREVTRRTIEKEALTRMPGTRGDALRTIELLPGVAQPPIGAGIVLIRGAAPGDSAVLLEGIPVPLLYHFGGLTSFYNSRALERIDFYPGNFSARYGRQIGGIIDVGVRDPNREGYHGLVDTNLPLDSSALVEGPIGDKAGFLAAGRRSYFGEIASAVIPEGTFRAFPAPFYWDYQSNITYDATERDQLRFMAYGAGDDIKVILAEAPDDQPNIRSIEAETSFHTVQVGWRRRYSPKLDHKIEVAYGRILNDFNLGPDLQFDLGVNALVTRAEWRYRISPRAQLRVGTDTQLIDFDVQFRGPQPGQQEGEPQGGSLSQLPILEAQDQQREWMPSLYVENELRPLDPLRIVMGLRLDYYDGIEEFTFDPRLSAHYSLTDETTLKAGVGVYSQPPEPQEWSPEIGNPNLNPIRSLHYALGVDHEFGDGAYSLGVEGFYKNLYQRVVGTPNNAEPFFTNDGIGRIYGLEVAGRIYPVGRMVGFLSYTLMRSERNDRGEGWRLFDFDQTHILTSALTYKLNQGWELGGTLRLWSGNLRTPVAGASKDLDNDVYSPEYGEVNSRRAPFSHRLDVRVQKTWQFDAWQLAWYLDVQNVYNSENPAGNVYSYNYRQTDTIRGLPIIPAVGLRGEF